MDATSDWDQLPVDAFANISFSPVPITDHCKWIDCHEIATGAIEKLDRRVQLSPSLLSHAMPTSLI
jgi:hypothetical protein